MIVIAIIGILTAIAIPNFISYRNKSYCSATESDANAIAIAVYDYYSTGGRTGYPPTITDLGITLSHGNTMALGGSIDGAIIAVTDGSGLCPDSYQNSNSNWSGGVYTKNM